MMSTRSGRTRQSVVEASPPRNRKGVSPTRTPARNRKSSPGGRSLPKSPSIKSPSRKPTSRSPARKSPSRTVKESTVKETKEGKEIIKSPSKRAVIKKNAEVRLEDVSAKIELLRTRSRRVDYSVSDIINLPKATDIFKRTDPPKSDLKTSVKLNGIDELETRDNLDDIISYSIRNRRNAEEIGPRRSSRLRDVVDSIPDIRRSFTKSLSKSISKSVSQSIDAYSDEEDLEEVFNKRDHSNSQTIRKLSTPLPTAKLSAKSDRFEFGGRIGASLLYLLIPTTVFYMLICCSKFCSYKSFYDLLIYKNVSLLFNIHATAIVISNLLLQALILLIPVFGTKEVDDKGRKFYVNALFSSFCTVTLLFGLDYFGMLKYDTILNSYLPMATVSYIVAVLLVLIMFINRGKATDNDLNPYGSSGYTFYDVFIGRQIQASFMRMNIKLWISRVSNISALILSILIFKHGFNINFEVKDISNVTLEELRNVPNKIQFKPTILVYSMMQIIYALYFILRERKIISTFYWNSEGLGYLQIVSSALYPYYFTSISKYIAEVDLKLPTNILTAVSAIFLLGFFIMLISNNIKYEFRKNPLQPSLIHLDSMPTFHGKKLLVSNLWGLVRHPNYTGDILIHVALAVPGIVSQRLVAAAPALLTILMLVHRSWRDHQRCRRRYGAAWQRYCTRVPSVFVPKVL